MNYNASLGYYYYGGYYDPAYNYLLNSLNLAQMKGLGIGNIDHPGTPIHVTGAVIIKVVHMLFGTYSEMDRDVFSNPEFYLKFYCYGFIILNTIAVFLMGFLTYTSTGSLPAALLIQFTPFFSKVVCFELINITSEPFIIMGVMILAGFSIYYTVKESNTEQNKLKYIIYFGICMGFLLACKISTFPLFFLPLILLTNLKYRFYFFLFTFIAFMIFILPAFSISNVEKKINWIFNVITHSEKYGEGSEGFINYNMIIPNLNSIFIKNPLFSVSYVLILFGVLLRFFPGVKNRIKSKNYYRLVTAIFVTMTLQILIVVKHFELHYMIPAYLLSVTGLFSVNEVFRQIFPFLFKKLKYSYLFVILFSMFAYQLFLIAEDNKYLSKRRSESQKILNFVNENCKNEIVVVSTGASSKEHSLWLGIIEGVALSKKQYEDMLTEMYPNTYHYDRFRNKFDSMYDPEKLKSTFLNKGKVVFQCDKDEYLEDFIITLKQTTGKNETAYNLLYSNYRNESVFEVIFR